MISQISPAQKQALRNEGLPHLKFLERKQLDGLFSNLCDFALPLAPLCEKVWEAQRMHLMALIEAMQSRDLEIVLVKGAEHTEALFRSRPLLFRSDIDILVPRTQLEATKTLLLELGYSQSLFDTNQGTLVAGDPNEIARYEKDHYNLRSFAKLARIDLRDCPQSAEDRWIHPLVVKNGEGICVIAIDVSCGFDRKTDPAVFFNRAVPSAFSGALTLCPEDHLWTSAALNYLYLFSTPSPGLAKLAAIVAMVNSRQINWDIILEIAEQYQLRPSFFYTFHFVARLLPGKIPTEVLSELDPRKGIRVRDFGWLLPKAFDITDPFPFSIEANDLSL
jgi:hypothetical protein